VDTKKKGKTKGESKTRKKGDKTEVVEEEEEKTRRR
jgi:hypothetical protein